MPVINKEIQLKSSMKYYEIGVKTGLSLPTIKRAFKGENVSPKTAEKIKKAVSGIIEKYNQ